MKKITPFVMLISAALSLSVRATSVNFSASGLSRTVVNSTDTTLSTVAPGSLIWEGVFSNTGSFTYNPALSVTQNVSNIESANGWTQFSLTATSNTLSVHSAFGGVVQASGGVTDNTANATAFNGKEVYIWIFNGTTVSASTSMGIFTSTSWVYPTNSGGVGDVSSFDTTSGTSITAAVGSVSNTGGPDSNGTLRLAATPEPTALISLLGGSGLVALLRRRRSE